MPQITVTLPGPPEAIWATLTTPDRMALWMGDVREVAVLDGGALRKGAVLKFETRGKRVQSEVIAFDAPHRLVLRSRQGPVEAVYSYSLEGENPVAFTHEVSCRMTGPLFVLRPLIQRTLWRTDGGQAQRLKDLLTDADPAPRTP